MNMIMVICPEGRDGDVRALIQQHAVHAFTQIRDALGEGETR